MVRRAGRVEILPMARRTQHRPGRELAVAMAGYAADRSMRSIQRNTRHPAVIPVDRAPRDGTMALLALGAEPRLIAIVFATYPVTRVARRRRAGILLIQMTRRTRHREMSSFEPERGCVVKRAIRRLELRLDGPIEDENHTHDKRGQRRKQHSIHGW